MDADAAAEPTDAVGLADRLPGWVVVYLKGVAMGVADSVPGVSGGTIALVTGIYERLVTAIAAADPRVLAHALRLHDAGERAALVTDLREMDVPFLLVLGAGIVTAVVVATQGLAVALEEHTTLTHAFFFGLIGASAVVLYGEVSLGTPRRVALAAVGVLAAALLTGETAASVPHTAPFVFVAGAIAITAMILPGVSGAFLLLVLGQYEFMVETLEGAIDAVAALAGGGRPDALLGPATTIATFVAGAVVGLLTVAHAIRWALDRYRQATLTLLVSLMAGGLRLPAERVADAWAGTPASAAAVALAAAAGAAAVLALDRYTDDLDYA